MFEVIGKIAIIPKAGQKKEKKELKELALKLLRQKNIEAVYLREKIKGRLRLPALKWLAGKKKTETIHKEAGCLMKLDIKKCYFSPRLGTDRLEIAKKVKKGEKILVMFAGVAPYALIIAKHSKAKEVYCVEISSIACKYARENVRINKFENIKIIQGDVKKIIPKLRMKFDRIIMARPQLKESFLREAFLVGKKGKVVHFYDFLNKE